MSNICSSVVNVHENVERTLAIAVNRLRMVDGQAEAQR